MLRTFQLHISDSAGRVERLVLRFPEAGGELILGSDPGVDLRPAAPGVSPRQCAFRLNEAGLITVQNLSLESPTRINGRSGVGPENLRESDKLEFGGLTGRLAALPSTESASKVPIPGGPVPREAVSRPDAPRIEIPRSENLRRSSQAPASAQSKPPASASATPPPEHNPPQPILPQEGAPEPTQQPAPGARQPASPAVATLRPASTPGIRPPAASPPANPTPPLASAPKADTSGASTRLRLATLRPATLRPTPPSSPAPSLPAQPAQPPTRAIPPPSFAPGGTEQGGAQSAATIEKLIARIVGAVRADLPAQSAPYTDAHLRALAIQGRSNAITLGFTTEEHIVAFVKCIVLVGDDLASSDSKFPDIYFCLTLQGKPAEARIERALKIAGRVNARGGVDLAPMPTIDLSSPHSLDPIVSPPPAEEQVSEEILPSDTQQKSAAPPPSPPASPSHPSPQSPPHSPHPREPASPPAHQQPSRQAARPPRENRERDATQPMANAAAAPPAHHPPEPPHPEKLPEIEGFKILEKIGSGGMGTVYRAYHHRLEVEVAIKIFKSLHPEAKTLLSREARAAARLQHPNIVQVLDYQEFGKGAYYAMQLVKGEDAHELIVRVSGRMVHEAEADGVVRALGLTNDQLSPEARSILQGKQPWHRLVAWWMAGVADGLDRAHREGIVHRDIKPSNLLLARDGRMTITDFGLALRRDDPTVGGNTARAGTPRYLAPERIADWASGADLSGTDGRIDTWALGATLYELLTYRPAYDGAREAVMRDIVTIEPLPPSQVIWAVPPELDRICLTAMKRNPEERFQQAGEMASALRAWLMGDPGTKGAGQPGVFKRFKK